MIRILMASTAIATLAVTGALAQAGADRFLTAADDATLASRLIGETVYSSAADDAETIGEVSDLIVGADGEIDAALIGVGGFLGVGQKDVAVSFDSLNIALDSDRDRVVVLETTRDELEAAPAFDTAAFDAPAVAADRTAQAPVTTDPTGMTTVPRRDTLQTVEVGTIGSDSVVGETLYSATDESIGAVSEVVMTADGQIDAVIVDVGGFLGIGAKSVAIAFSDLDFRADENGNVYVYTAFTRDQVEAAAEYNADAYEQNRDAVLLRSTN